ncbi:MAG: DNA-deoxyinosine glycosylase [Alphaproteobacteria bacterium]
MRRAMPRASASPPSPILRSFAPLADARSRVLVLGTMPGPEALRKQEYYGFKGNHFWKIMTDLLAPGRSLDYAQKLALLRRHRIAVWDVLRSCTREGAADSAIRDTDAQRHPGLARAPSRHSHRLLQRHDERAPVRAVFRRRGRASDDRAAVHQPGPRHDGLRREAHAVDGCDRPRPRR